LIVALELRDLVPLLETVLKSDSRSMDSRAHAAEALVSLRHDGRLSAVTPLLAEPQTPATLRQQILQAVLEPTDKSTVATMTAAVQMLSASHQLQLANRLAGTSAGAELLLQLIEQGHAGGRLLQNPALAARLKACGLPDIDQRIVTLTKNLPAVNEQLRTLMDHRRQRFRMQPGSAKQGVDVYRKNCAACHRIGTLGEKIGPQLDGIGNRGLDRLLEDILDPNRNVDGAFRTTTLALRSGRIVSGLVRREEGQTLVLADDRGKEFSIPRSEIEEESVSAVSLMPGNLGEVLTEAQLCDLLAFLLSQGQAPAETSR
jgi:putative heme-binding domain-containing protein